MLALCGGVGGAKLALGLSRALGSNLALVVNTGDDFEHLGLSISPDLDTVLYTLGGLSDEARGWGRANETWTFMAALAALGGETWFQLGDGDLALHVERTRRLKEGESLSRITADLARRLGIAARILPMSDDPVRTFVKTAGHGVLPFQRYFVQHRCEPVVTGLEFRGAGSARPSQAVLDILQGPDVAAVLICPSNPYLSVDPILAMPSFSSVLADVEVPVVAISPLIGGAAVKGPTAKIMAELNIRPGSAEIADHYAGLIDGLLIHEADVADLKDVKIAARTAQTLMKTLADREALAHAVLAFANDLRSGTARAR